MLWGMIAFVMYIFLLLKIVSRKLKWHTTDQILRRIHLPVGVSIIAVIGIHFFKTMDIWSTRSVMVVGTGIGAAILLLLMAVGYGFRKKLKGRWMIWHRIGALMIAVLLISHIGCYYIDFFSYQRKISSINIIGIDASHVKDGTYEGEYDAGYIYAKVEVTIHQGQISDIDLLKHDNERGAPAQAVIGHIMEQQNTGADAISGATNSSLVIEKAIENALLKGM